MKYTDEFLISELHRFIKEFGFIPTATDMDTAKGYPSVQAYKNHFDTWNKSLEAANLKVNQTNEKRIGNETCCKCGCGRKQTENWITKGLLKGQVMCRNCYYDIDYVKGNLDPNSNTGFAFISQRVVAKVLGLEMKDDCNCSVNFGAAYDLYDKEKYGYINVKVSKLNNYNRWEFKLTQKETPDTYIFLGFSYDKKDILRVWITDPLDDLTYDERTGSSKIGICTTNEYLSGIRGGLTKAEPWKVDAEQYDDALHSMSLDKCEYLRN